MRNKISRQTLAITTISINIPIVMPRVIYDRVRIRKNYFEIPAFLPIKRGISKAEKFIITETCTFVFSFEFKKMTISKKFPFLHL